MGVVAHHLLFFPVAPWLPTANIWSQDEKFGRNWGMSGRSFQLLPGVLKFLPIKYGVQH
jgi:hypothetical protein